MSDTKYYGYRRITDELRNRKCLVNHKKMQRIMGELSLKSIVRMKIYRSYKGSIEKIAPNIWIATLTLQNRARSG